MAVIHVSGFRKTYGPTVAVGGVSFNVNAGEIFGLSSETIETRASRLAQAMEPAAGSSFGRGKHVPDGASGCRTDLALALGAS
jgi:ABC-type phosphonate transport system ATPase subunit